MIEHLHGTGEPSGPEPPAAAGASEGDLYELDNRLGMAVAAAQRLAACRAEAELYRCLLGEFGRITASRGGSIYLREGEVLELVDSLDPGHAPAVIERAGEGSSILCRALTGRVPLLMPDLATDGEFSGSGWGGYRDGSFLVLPIFDHSDSAVGALSLHNRRRPPFTAEDLDLGLILLSVCSEVVRSLRASEAVHKSEERFRHLVENASDIVCVLDGKGTIRYVGPSLSHVLGYRPEQAQGANALDVIDPGDREQAVLLLQDLEQRAGSMRSVTLRFRHADGSWRVLETLAKNAIDEPAVGGIVANARDVTEREEARRREAEQEEQLFQAAKLASLGTLVSGIAHEINNPNNFIRLNADNLRSLWEDIERVLDGADRDSPLTLKGLPYADARTMAREMLSGLLEGSYRIERLVGSLRDYARRRDSQHMEPVDVNRVVESALTIMGSVVRKSTSCFAFEPGEALPAILGDPHQIEQVVINLLTNACQALPGRTSAVTVSTCYDPSTKEVMVTVADEGNGIAPEHMERITEPFFTTKRGSGGMGLGLSICDRIARNHGGRLEFVSAPGSGTRATIALPTRH